jgi:hypothetical protein
LSVLVGVAYGIFFVLKNSAVKEVEFPLNSKYSFPFARMGFNRGSFAR